MLLVKVIDGGWEYIAIQLKLINGRCTNDEGELVDCRGTEVYLSIVVWVLLILFIEKEFQCMVWFLSVEMSILMIFVWIRGSLSQLPNKVCCDWFVSSIRVRAHQRAVLWCHRSHDECQQWHWCVWDMCLTIFILDQLSALLQTPSHRVVLWLFCWSEKVKDQSQGCLMMPKEPSWTPAVISMCLRCVSHHLDPWSASNPPIEERSQSQSCVVMTLP